MIQIIGKENRVLKTSTLSSKIHSNFVSPDSNKSFTPKRHKKISRTKSAYMSLTKTFLNRRKVHPAGKYLIESPILRESNKSKSSAGKRSSKRSLIYYQLPKLINEARLKKQPYVPLQTRRFKSPQDNISNNNRNNRNMNTPKKKKNIIRPISSPTGNRRVLRAKKLNYFSRRERNFDNVNHWSIDKNEVYEILSKYSFGMEKMSSKVLDKICKSNVNVMPMIERVKKQRKQCFAGNYQFFQPNRLVKVNKFQRL